MLSLGDATRSVRKEGMIKVFIVEDHPIFSMGMSALINQEPDLHVCGVAENVERAEQEVSRLGPDMVIVDLSLQDSDGIDFIRNNCRSGRQLPILVVSMHDESLHAERCLQAGARGYIMKQEASELVIKAIRQIVAGNSYVSSRILNKVVGRLAGAGQAAGDGGGQLSERELEVLGLIGKGFSTSEIAAKLHVSPKTVGTYRERLKEKMGFLQGGELVRYAILRAEGVVE